MVFSSFRRSVFPSFLLSLFVCLFLPLFPFFLHALPSLSPPFLFLSASFLAYSLHSSLIPSFPFPLFTFPPSAFLPPRPFFFPSNILRHFSTPLMHSPLARTTFVFLHSCLPSVLYALIPSLGPSFPPNFAPKQNQTKNRQTWMPRSLEASKCLGGIREAITIYKNAIPLL